MGRILGTRVARASIVVLATIAVAVVGLGAVVGGASASASGAAGVVGTVLDDTTVPPVPVDGVEVCVVGGGLRTCDTTETDGRYGFGGLAAGSYTLTATPPVGTAYLPIGGTGPYVPVPAVSVDLAPGAVEQDLRLLKGGALEVTVVEPDGATRASGQPVTLCRTDDAGPGSCPDSIAFPDTDAAGESVGPPLLPGVYRVTAGRGTATVGAVTVDDVVVDAETTTPQRLRLVDIAPPIVTGTATGVVGANGWFRSAVTVTWAVVDPAPSSGLQLPLPAPSTFGTEGANTYLSDEAYDEAGNHAPGRILLKIDSIVPVVTCPADPHYAPDQAGATISATVGDPTAGSSGPEATTVSAPVDTSVAGPGSVSITGRDLAGNETTVSCGYLVEDTAAYEFAGFGWPVDNRAVNVVKSGRNVPITWRVTDAGGRPVTGPGTVVGITSGVIACPDLRSDLVKLTVPFAVAPTHLGRGVWLATWTAPKAVPGSCIEMRLTLDDGGVHTAVFRVVK